jgi:hypothetical protein
VRDDQGEREGLSPSPGEIALFAGDNVLAVATLGRILHHAIIVSINDQSFRLSDKRKAGLLAAPSKAPKN